LPAKILIPGQRAHIEKELTTVTGLRADPPAPRFRRAARSHPGYIADSMRAGHRLRTPEHGARRFRDTHTQHRAVDWLVANLLTDHDNRRTIPRRAF
jgi:hypothetical protein